MINYPNSDSGSPHRQRTSLPIILIATILCLASAGESLAVDCNGNSIEDNIDISGGTSFDCNGDGTPDECEVSTAFSAALLVATTGSVRDIFPADLDNDGDLDVLTSALSSLKVQWFENTDRLGTFVSRQSISSLGIGPSSVRAADLDNDGDLDLLIGWLAHRQITWHENLDGIGDFSSERIIYSGPEEIRVSAVMARDLDGDNDLDVLCSIREDSEIAWFENIDGLGSFGPKHSITTDAVRAYGIHAADLDGDGDLDVLSASTFIGISAHRIAWYENADGLGGFGPQQIISTDALGSTSVFAADIDGDGDVDVLSASQLDDKIAWYENTDGSGSFGQQRIITTDTNTPFAVFAVDLDGDDDIDVLSASSADDKVAWYENIDGLGGFGPQNILSDNADLAVAVTAADINGDGNMDVMSASAFDGRILWFKKSPDDCNGNEIPDECELNGDDCNLNGALDVCELGNNDCNGNEIPDNCEPGMIDCNFNGIPDECELVTNDCNINGIPDGCELSGNDCNQNHIPDDCELNGSDCNDNGQPDECELLGNDCNLNNIPDDCEPADICLAPCEAIVLDEDFASYRVGEDPVDWFDSDDSSNDNGDDSLFKVFQVGADLVLGTDSNLINIHSHYVGDSAESLSTLTYTGRMRISDDNGGIGVTFLSKISDQPTAAHDYLRLRRAAYSPSARTFHLAPPDLSNLIGTLDSGVDPIADTWYRFRIEVDTTGPQLHIQANVWEEGQLEPTGFQIDAIDPSGSHPTFGTVGVWSMADGSKYWDDLFVIDRSAPIACDDGDPCTENDACSNGVCAGVPMDCSFLNNVCAVGECNANLGVCEAIPVDEGGECDDSDPCTINDTCGLGKCAGTVIDCSYLDDDCMAGVCDSDTGKCEIAMANEGGDCDDQDGCSTNDMCSNGLCLGTPIDCSTLDDACAVGVCNSSNGLCETIPVNDGGSCDDLSNCTIGEVCSNGSCIGEPVDCSFLDDVCMVGTCNPVTGLCESAPAKDGASCDDQDACTDADKCSGGLCVGVPIDCSVFDSTCGVGGCNPTNGSCEITPINEGGACDDLSNCTVGDVCLDGLCMGTQVDCSFLDDMCEVGVCNVFTGQCETVPANEGGACADMDPCTPIDVCIAGVCTGTRRNCSSAWPPECEKILFVDGSAANGLNDGTSWNDAYVNLQDALAESSGNCGVTEIWVAAGTYKPDRGNGQTPGDRSATFQLQNALAIYGGFAGTEDCLDQRDPATNVTILSGDMNDDDVPIACEGDSPDCDSFGELCVNGFCAIRGNNAENSYHVVTSTAINEIATLDGFRITRGNANISSSVDGSGAGILNDSSFLHVVNCSFVANAAGAGAGMFNSSCNPTIKNCSFVGNAAGSFEASSGGGMYNFRSMPIIVNCVFALNTATNRGGGMYNVTSSMATITNCSFTANHSKRRGGGIHSGSSSPTICNNCTFSSNSAALGGAGIYNFSGGDSVLTNCILWGNTPDQIKAIDAMPTVNFCIVQGGWPSEGGIGVIDADPLFSDFDGADNIVGTEDDDLRLLPGSPAIDAGDNAALPAGVVTDIDGNSRFVDDPSTGDTGAGSSPIVDIGVFEFVLGDCNVDGVADLDDFGILVICLASSRDDNVAACRCLDLDVDGDVDLRDFALFQIGFGM